MRFSMKAYGNHYEEEKHTISVEKVVPGGKDNEYLRIEANGQVFRLEVSASGFVNVNFKPEVWDSNDLRLFVPSEPFPKTIGWLGLREIKERLASA